MSGFYMILQLFALHVCVYVCIWPYYLYVHLAKHQLEYNIIRMNLGYNSNNSKRKQVVRE